MPMKPAPNFSDILIKLISWSLTRPSTGTLLGVGDLINLAPTFLRLCFALHLRTPIDEGAPSILVRIGGDNNPSGCTYITHHLALVHAQ
jgi:hypothetical protein